MVFNVAVWTSKPLETDVAGSTISALAPLPIGFAVLAAHLVCGPYTGCGINPARVLGAIVFDDNITWESYTAKYAWIYFVGPYQPSIAIPPTTPLAFFKREDNVMECHGSLNTGCTTGRRGGTLQLCSSSSIRGTRHCSILSKPASKQAPPPLPFMLMCGLFDDVVALFQ